MLLFGHRPLLSFNFKWIRQVLHLISDLSQSIIELLWELQLIVDGAIWCDLLMTESLANFWTCWVVKHRQDEVLYNLGGQFRRYLVKVDLLVPRLECFAEVTFGGRWWSDAASSRLCCIVLTLWMLNRWLHGEQTWRVFLSLHRSGHGKLPICLGVDSWRWLGSCNGDLGLSKIRQFLHIHLLLWINQSCLVGASLLILHQ